MLAAIALATSVIITPTGDAIKMSPTPAKPICLMNVDATTIVNAKDVVRAQATPTEVRFFLKDVAEPVTVALKEGQDGLALITDFMDRTAESCK